MPRARLLKVVVQVIAVIEDDDGTLTEQATEPVAVSARDWPAYMAGGFDQSWNALAATVEGPPPSVRDEL